MNVKEFRKFWAKIEKNTPRELLVILGLLLDEILILQKRVAVLENPKKYIKIIEELVDFESKYKERCEKIIKHINSKQKEQA